MKNKKRLSLNNIIYSHISNNSKEYIFFSLIFIVGIFLGVMFINNVKEEQKVEITAYLNKFIDTLKETEKLDNVKILKNTINENIIIGVALWFFGTTVIRIANCFWNNSI